MKQKGTLFSLKSEKVEFLSTLILPESIHCRTQTENTTEENYLSFACIVHSVSVELQIALEGCCLLILTRIEMKTKDIEDDNKDDNKEGKEGDATFFDMSEMSMLSFSRQPEI